MAVYHLPQSSLHIASHVLAVCVSANRIIRSDIIVRVFWMMSCKQTARALVHCRCHFKPAASFPGLPLLGAHRILRLHGGVVFPGSPSGEEQCWVQGWWFPRHQPHPCGTRPVYRVPHDPQGAHQRCPALLAGTQPKGEGRGEEG